MIILKAQNLFKTYGKGENLIRSLNGVSFEVKKGEFIAIVGPSGSGKSTLMHILGGVDRPTNGKVFVDGLDIFTKNESELTIFRRRNIGIVYQFYNLLPTLTAEENILLPYLLDKREPNKSKAEELLEIIGLKERKNHFPYQLSGGEQQRVSVARALMNDPRVILADEPTGNLDSASGKTVMGLLTYANIKFEQTLILITHDEKIALAADRIITITDGKITSDINKKEVTKV